MLLIAVFIKAAVPAERVEVLAAVPAERVRLMAVRPQLVRHWAVVVVVALQVVVFLVMEQEQVGHQGKLL